MQRQPGLQHNDITRELAQRLARLRLPSEARVLSLYLDLDPSENLALPRARRSAITQLIDEARRQAEAERELTHEQRMVLRSDIQRARELLEQRALHGDLAAGARALAVFACAPVSLFEALRLPRPARSRVAVARRAVLQPLAEIGPPRSLAVLLCDGDDARLLESEGERLVEVQRLTDELRRRAGHGVWAPERTDAPLAEDQLAHVRRAVELLAEHDRQRRYERIAIGADERIYREIQRRLDGELRPRLVGRFDVDVDEASLVEVRARVEPLLGAADEQGRRAALQRLAERGACGLDAALTAVHERRAAMLLLKEGLEHPGSVCPRCGRAQIDLGPCPVDGSATEEEPNIVDWAVAQALDQDAEILVLRQGLEHCDGLGALLRF